VATIDLNADLGEGAAFDPELLEIVSSCNIACGGHAGDATSMATCVALAVANKVVIGAHPSYPDRAGFGRRRRFMSGNELEQSLINQLDELCAVVQAGGGMLSHAKPHGALYHDAAVDLSLAESVLRAVRMVCANAAVVGPPESALEVVAARHHMPFIAEAFVDRAYCADGSLVSRAEANAMHGDINTITAQAVKLATEGSVTTESGDAIQIRADTLCIHGDLPNAGEIARAVHDVLLANGIEIHAPA